MSGTVVACCLVRHGLATLENVLDMIWDLRKYTGHSDKLSTETRESYKR